MIQIVAVCLQRSQSDDTGRLVALVMVWRRLLTLLRGGIARDEIERGETTQETPTRADVEAELRQLREDNDALRFSSLRFGELAERLSQRVHELERRLRERDSLNAPTGGTIQTTTILGRFIPSADGKDANPNLPDSGR